MMNKMIVKRKSAKPHPEKAKRYIVAGKFGVLQIGHYDDTPIHGILLHGEHATVFQSYASAKRAIERTKKYAKKNHYDWDERYLKPILIKDGYTVRSQK